MLRKQQQKNKKETPPKQQKSDMKTSRTIEKKKRGKLATLKIEALKKPLNDNVKQTSLQKD